MNECLEERGDARSYTPNLPCGQAVTIGRIHNWSLLFVAAVFSRRPTHLIYQGLFQSRLSQGQFQVAKGSNLDRYRSQDHDALVRPQTTLDIFQRKRNGIRGQEAGRIDAENKAGRPPLQLGAREDGLLDAIESI